VGRQTLHVCGKENSVLCGISGIVMAGRPPLRRSLAAMNRAQIHRGPDDDGAVVIELPSTVVGFGHRRLSILDLTAAGHQPMTNPDTGDVITYNGEIYNSPELRVELAQAGAQFRGHSDTEVILAAYARWGEDAIHRLDGMFAFALYRARERRLYLARDPLGIKPLYVAQTPRGLAFASELRGVVASGLVDTTLLDRRAVASLLAYGAVASPLTMLQQVAQVEAGCWVCIDLAVPFVPSTAAAGSTRWWTPPSTLAVRGDDAAIGRELASTVRTSVRRHLLSDVPVAVFLSGGVDSLAVAALASEARGGDLDTFTIMLSNDPELDEGDEAERAARQLGVRHQSIRLADAEAEGLIEAWMMSMDQPTVDGLNTYAIAKAVRERGFKVALSGLGGDELFGGYPSFRSVPWLAGAASMARWIPASARVALASTLTTGMSATVRRKARDFAAAAPDPAALTLSYALLRRRLFSEEQMEAFGFLGEAGLTTNFVPEAFRGACQVTTNRWAVVRNVELHGYMANMLLRDTDVFGMAHGLEIRVPLLDRRLVDQTLGYARPMRRLVLGSNPKPWLVAAAGVRLPRASARRPKRGFTLPIARWMSGMLRGAMETRIESLANGGIFEGDAVRSVWAEFLRAPRSPAWSRAWTLAALAQWTQNIQSLERSVRDEPAGPPTAA
jgi:asparagine synthase (glutamine-hydrolysing)